MAGDDGLNFERWLVSKGIWKDVVDRDVDALLEQIVFENDETSIDRGRVANDVLPVVEDLCRRDGTGGNIKVW